MVFATPVMVFATPVMVFATPVIVFATPVMSFATPFMAYEKFSLSCIHALESQLELGCRYKRCQSLQKKHYLTPQRFCLQDA
jgi:hypothetical protein